MADIFSVPEVLLPQKGISLEKWAVVACDQYTSEPEYWKRVENFTGGSPSTLDLIFPEVYLEEPGESERIASINNNMMTYMDSILEPVKGFVLVERQTGSGVPRKGLLLCIDLEAYDYTPGTSAPVRATEGTVMERLPPRIRIRRGACLECPHIMVLIEDKENTVIVPLFGERDKYETLYDFDLMENGGNIKGYLISDTSLQTDIIRKLNALDKDGFLVAVGDGNHSLATAKEIWKNFKKSLSEPEQITHPARYALVEAVNVFDEALVFEPIHRVLFDPGNFCEMHGFTEKKPDNEKAHIIRCISQGRKGFIVFPDPSHNLPVGTLQEALDKFLKQNKTARIDYIHGEEVVERLCGGNAAGFILEPMDKEALFATVEKDGVLPRKTFSMGEAYEKRYYLECRRIIV